MRVGRNIKEQLPDCCRGNNVLLCVSIAVYRSHDTAALRLPVGCELAANLRGTPPFRFKWRI